jgi:membrane fusion protein, multidrug efflux system
MRTTTLIAIAAGALLLAGCKDKQAVTQAPPAQSSAVSAAVITLAAENFTTSVPVTGTLVSNSRVDIKAETIGKVIRFDKEEGDPVKAGEPVVWVNDENAQLAVRQAQTAVKVAEASIERAKVVEAHSQSELDRARNLLKSGGITDKDLKAAQLAEQDAKAQLSLATAQREEAQAALDVAGKRVRDTVIQSPVSGAIQRKFIAKGAYVEAPTALFTVVDNSRLELEAPVAASDLAPVRPGLRVTFTVNSYPGQEFQGQVIEVAPAVDTDTRTAKVRIRVSNEGGKLKAGMFAQGAILTGVKTNAIVVPASAVYRDDRSAKASYAFVVIQGKAAKRNVRIGAERDGRLEIIEGLKAGDVLVADQSMELADGVGVQPKS